MINELTLSFHQPCCTLNGNPCLKCLLEHNFTPDLNRTQANNFSSPQILILSSICVVCFVIMLSKSHLSSLPHLCDKQQIKQGALVVDGSQTVENVTENQSTIFPKFMIIQCQTKEIYDRLLLEEKIKRPSVNKLKLITI